MRILPLSLLLLLGFISIVSHADANDKIKAELQKQLGSTAQIKTISPAPIPGLFEVVINNTVVYTDASAK